MQIIIDAPWDNLVLAGIICILFVVAIFSLLDSRFYRTLWQEALEKVEDLKDLWDKEPECGCECCKLDQELAEAEQSEEDETEEETITPKDKGPGINRFYLAGRSAIK